VLKNTDFDVELESATETHAEALCDLLNAAYRGTSGWTTERKLVSGDRITPADLVSNLSNPDFHLFVYQKLNELIGCIGIEMNATDAYIGSFAVHPNHQNTGLGKKILKHAELYAINTLNSKRLVMKVIAQRETLIAFYERQGYKRNGTVEAYPSHLNVGIPRISGITIELLFKDI